MGKRGPGRLTLSRPLLLLPGRPTHDLCKRGTEAAGWGHATMNGQTESLAWLELLVKNWDDGNYRAPSAKVVEYP